MDLQINGNRYISQIQQPLVKKKTLNVTKQTIMKLQ